MVPRPARLRILSSRTRPPTGRPVSINVSPADVTDNRHRYHCQPADAQMLKLRRPMNSGGEAPSG